MNKLLKKVLHYSFRPLLQQYLKKERAYHYKGIHIKVLPGVFHPAFFYSTKILLEFLDKLSLENKKLLELGAGTGLISLFSAKKGAIVSASDISTIAIKNIQLNQRLNNCSFTVYPSDLFSNLPSQTFDYIIINPPFYKGVSIPESGYAWYAGKNNEYFQKLFVQMKSFCHQKTEVYMILSEKSDGEYIFSEAVNNGYRLETTSVHKRPGEKLILYRIMKKD